MAKQTPQPEPSGEIDLTGAAAVAVIDDGQPLDEIEAAAQRAGNFIATRGFGPRTTQLIVYMAQQAVAEADLNVVITEQLAERLLNASSVDDILQPFDPEQGKAHYGKSLLIMGCSFIESDYEGFPWYVSLECKRPGSGEMFVVTVGGEKIVMQAAAAHMHNAFPMFAMIYQAEKATKAGFHPLELRPGVSV